MIRKIEFLRVALFADSFADVDGVAMTCERLADLARERGYPFLCVHGSNVTETVKTGTVTRLSLKRSPLALSLDQTLAYDPLLFRHLRRVARALDEFQPDIIHLTGLNDISNVAAWFAYRRQIPLVGSWHTNLHEFASRRMQNKLRFLPPALVSRIAGRAEKEILKWAIYFYKMPKLVLAPNPELVQILADGTGREARLMLRGVDSELFSPAKRTVSDRIFRLGFVGRLQAEKNVGLLAEIERRLIEAGRRDFKFLIVGEGSERAALETAMPSAEFTGFLSGDNLAAAYANMDLFIFPSQTDTFGNVVQEAMAAGIPVITLREGGPKYLIEHGTNGYVAAGADEIVGRILDLMENPDKLTAMKASARQQILSRSWDTVFDRLYDSYHRAVEIAQLRAYARIAKHAP